MKRKILALLLVAAVLLALPVTAMAAKKATIKFPVKVGLMIEGEAVTLKPELKRVKLESLTWTSSDEAVLALAGNVLQALKPGKAVVTASGGGATAKLGVVVLPASVNVAVGDKVSLPRGGVESYKSKNKKVATISKKGVVKGVGVGTTKIVVTYGDQKKVVPVTVVEEIPQGSAAAELDCANEADQIVLVDYTGGSKAVLSVHEKLNGVWTELASCDAYVGKKGIGKTKEGDKKTPTGTYNLTTPFGIKDDPGAQMSYLKVTKYHYWCGDSSSKYYNQLVDEREVSRKHKSSDEYLIKYKGAYNYCMFIDYNAEGTPNRGSCIFLHCTGKNKYTAGCVAIPEKMMKQIIRWAREGTKIVIRQKP